MPTNNQPCDRSVYIAYTNHRGEHNPRRLITPIRLVFRKVEWYPQACWLVEAWDHDKAGFRDFALSAIRDMTPYVPEE